MKLGWKFNLQASTEPENGGSVKLEPSGRSYDNGTKVTAVANPTKGYEFENWFGDVTGTSKSVTVTINGDKMITAHFEKKEEGLPLTWIALGLVTAISGVTVLLYLRKKF